MTIEIFIEIFGEIVEGTKNHSTHKASTAMRQAHLKAMLNPGIVKVAFDSRRINQETEFNPRRGLQFYNRSDSFISEGVASKMKNFHKLKAALEILKNKYGRKPDWQDSYARVLLNSLDAALRTNQQDGDYTDNQPGVGSFSYLEEMIYVRYRLTVDDLTNMSEEELIKSLLSKDQDLTKDVNNAEITRTEAGSQPYDSLIEKLFGGIKATKENPEVERTVTITIKDKFVEQE